VYPEAPVGELPRTRFGICCSQDEPTLQSVLKDIGESCTRVRKRNKADPMKIVVDFATPVQENILIVGISRRQISTTNFLLAVSSGEIETGRRCGGIGSGAAKVLFHEIADLCQSPT
jgi:hypothetical protein